MASMYGLIFDVDGVIADSEAVNVRATSRVFEDVLGITGVLTEDFRLGIGRGAQEYVKAGARAHGRDLSPEEVAKAVIARQETFIAMLKADTLPAFPGVLELISGALADPALRLAIGTSSTREKSMSVLESAHVPFDKMAYVCGGDVTNKKPHPEVFTVACQRLELAPQRCVVIEDAPNGVEAAHAAGCTCIAVTNTCTRDELQQADRVVDSLIHVSVDTIKQLIE
jgi:beta-phosphoglucomutase